MEWERLLFRFLFPLKGQQKLARVSVESCWSVFEFLLEGGWLTRMLQGLLLGLPGAAVGEGVALSLHVLCWPGARELCGPDFVVVLTFLC